MANRFLLHKSQELAFLRFLRQNNIPFTSALFYDNMPDYQRIRITMEDGTIQAIYERKRGDHFTVPPRLIPLVKRFIETQRN